MLATFSYKHTQTFYGNSHVPVVPHSSKVHANAVPHCDPESESSNWPITTQALFSNTCRLPLAQKPFMSMRTGYHYRISQSVQGVYGILSWQRLFLNGCTGAFGGTWRGDTRIHLILKHLACASKAPIGDVFELGHDAQVPRLIESLDDRWFLNATGGG